VGSTFTAPFPVCIRQEGPTGDDKLILSGIDDENPRCCSSAVTTSRLRRLRGDHRTAIGRRERFGRSDLERARILYPGRLHAAASRTGSRSVAANWRARANPTPCLVMLNSRARSKPKGAGPSSSAPRLRPQPVQHHRAAGAGPRLPAPRRRAAVVPRNVPDRRNKTRNRVFGRIRAQPRRQADRRTARESTCSATWSRPHVGSSSPASISVNPGLGLRGVADHAHDRHFRPPSAAKRSRRGAATNPKHILTVHAPCTNSLGWEDLLSPSAPRGFTPRRHPRAGHAPTPAIIRLPSPPDPPADA